MSEKKQPDIYQVKVTLEGIRPPIWRRILVTSDTTLGKLHSILQVVMGWDDYHLITTLPHVKPLPKAAKTIRSSSLILPFSQASVKAIIIEAAVVLPYFIMLL